MGLREKLGSRGSRVGIALAAVVVVSILLFVLLSVGVQRQEFAVSIEGAAGKPLEGIAVEYSFAGESGAVKTDAVGEAIVPVPFGVELGLCVPEIIVDGVEYFAAEETAFVEEGRLMKKIRLQRKHPVVVERTVVLNYPNGTRVKGVETSVKLFCSTGVTPLPQVVSDLDKDGVLVVKEPPNCGVMQAKVLSPEEFAGQSYLLDAETLVVGFEEQEWETGSLRARVLDEIGAVDGTSFLVSVRDADGIAVQQKYTQSFGEAVFTELLPGGYTVTANDETNGYGISVVKGVGVQANKTKSVEVWVSKTVKGIVGVKVLEEGTGTAVEGAKARLLDAKGRIVAEVSTGTGGEAEFALVDSGNYSVFVLHSDYLYGVLDLEGVLEGSFEIRIEPLTAENSGRVEVRVVDEKGSAVENATVKLRFLETGFIVPVEPEATDFEGIARFKGVKAGSYYAYVEKFPASGDNRAEGREIDIKLVEGFEVTLFVGTSTVRVKAVDSDGDPVMEAEAELFNVLGESIGRIPLTDGTGSYDLRADKSVYVVVRHSNLQAVQTMPKQLYPKQKTVFEVEMRPSNIGEKPDIMFLGIFGREGSMVEELEAGERYTAVFRLSFPETKGYEQGGAHIRVGNAALMQNDAIVIDGLLAGNSIALKGSTFHPFTGYWEDSKHFVQGNAKWVNLGWEQLEAMDYFIGVKVRVKGQAVPGTALPIYYRSWAEVKQGIVRDPFDAVLGSAENVVERQALYAETYLKEFYEGREAICGSDFCYSGEWVMDEERGLYLNKPYYARANALHTLHFNLVNVSPRVFGSSVMGIEAFGGMEIGSYRIVNADSTVLSGEKPEDGGIEGISLGNFTEGKSISAEVVFHAREPGIGGFLVKVVADGRIVLEQAVEVGVSAANQAEISVEPEVIASYAPSELLVKVWEKEHGLEKGIEKALVRITRVSPDKSRALWELYTNSMGMVKFALPGSHANSVVEIEAFKTGYYAEKARVFVDSNILGFDPRVMRETLNPKGEREKRINVVVKNNTWNELVIKDIAVSGNFRGYLDVLTMWNYAKSWEGTRIGPAEEQEMQLFIVKLSDYALEHLREAVKLEGEFLVTAENESIGEEYDLIVPIEAEIVLGGMPLNTPCISLSQGEWKAVTTGNRAVMEFELQNNCLGDKGSLRLDNLKARMQWISEPKGIVEIALVNNETGESISEVLRPIVWRHLFRGIGAEASYHGTITFTPNPAFIGQAAGFFVEIDGQIKTDAGPQFVGSSPNRISSEIDIINLNSCLSYETGQDILKIHGTSDEASFVVSSAECGNTNVDVILCKGDIGCASGTSEGYVQLSADSFTLTPGQNSKDITVKRGDLPGAYGVTVWARLPRMGYERVGEVVVEVETRPERYFDLDKYRFSVVGQGGMDSATITNKMFMENVEVTASICVWGKAIEQEDWDPKRAFWSGAISAAAGYGIKEVAVRMIAKHVVAKLMQNLSVKPMEFGATKAYDAALSALQRGADPDIATRIAQFEIQKAGGYAKLPTAPKKPSVYQGPAMAAVLSGAITYIQTKDPMQAMGAAIGSYLGGLACSLVPVPGATFVCSGLGSFAGQYLASLFGGEEDPCDQMQSDFIPDFVINLAGSLRTYKGKSFGSDLKGLYLSQYANSIFAAVNEEVRQIESDSEHGKEMMGIVFINNDGIEEAEAIYDVLTVSATEHIHQDPTHRNPKHVVLDKEAVPDFAPYAVPDSSTNNYVQKFHVRFKTKNIPSGLQRISLETFPCYQGTMVGRTGPGALPRTKLRWNWSDEDIPWNMCDADNPDAFYCDATQFTIMLLKRIHLIDEFLHENAYTFDCPRNPKYAKAEQAALSLNRDTNTQKVSSGKIGIETLKNERISNQALTATALLHNDSNYGLGSAKGKPVEVTFSLKSGGGADTDYYKTCVAEVEEIGAGEEKEVSCSFSDVQGSHKAYVLVAMPTKPQGFLLDGSYLVNFVFIEPELPFDAKCWISYSTNEYQSVPNLERFLDKSNPLYGEYVQEESVKWTDDVPRLDSLKELYSFRAYLMFDGYSTDFMEDFAEYFKEVGFFDAPYWFNGQGSKELIDFFERDTNFIIRRKYVPSTSLPGPGLYDVKVNLRYGEDDWDLFDKYGEPKADIVVELYKLDDPLPDSIFYYLPFNGNIGKDTENGRIGYGIDYRGEGKKFVITSQADFVEAAGIENSSPEVLVKTDIRHDFRAINSSFSERGMLLKINEGEAVWEKEMVFSPNYATPLMMRMRHGKDSEPFQAFYHLLEAGTPQKVGGTLFFWDGAGRCFDYSGLPVFEAFNFTPDREAMGEDPIYNWQYLYATEWQKAEYAGDVHLKNIVYTPINMSYSAKASAPKELAFVTPNSNYASSVDLEGIQGMPHNSKRGQDKVTELRELFELVESGHVCVTSSGVETSFWWNPKELYETAGTYKSMQEIEQGLVAGQNCIG